MYVDGKPLHHHTSARKEEWNEEDHNQSSIFIVDHPDFMEMDVNTIQDIYQHRHILVLGTGQKEESFSLNTLSKLGRLDRVIEMQGKSLQIIHGKLHILCRYGISHPNKSPRCSQECHFI